MIQLKELGSVELDENEQGHLMCLVIDQSFSNLAFGMPGSWTLELRLWSNTQGDVDLVMETTQFTQGVAVPGTALMDPVYHATTTKHALPNGLSRWCPIVMSRLAELHAFEKEHTK